MLYILYYTYRSLTRVGLLHIYNIVLGLISNINRINPKAIAKVFTRVFAHQGAPCLRWSSRAARLLVCAAPCSFVISIEYIINEQTNGMKSINKYAYVCSEVLYIMIYIYIHFIIIYIYTHIYTYSFIYSFIYIESL